MDKKQQIRELQRQAEHFSKYYDRCPAICWPRLESIHKAISNLQSY